MHMTPKRAIATVLALLLLPAVDLLASGRVGFYGLVEKVVFEPSEQAPERIQIWGTFAYANTRGGGADDGSVSSVQKGYLYFKLPPAGDPTLQAAKREWLDLKTVAGTGQAIGFGNWMYTGFFQELKPGVRSDSLVEFSAGRRTTADLRVRPASEPPAAPATYQTNVGIIKLASQGSLAGVVQQLKTTAASSK
jgi:hypothetical protein